MTVSICIGSSCHLKGSREIIKQLQDLVAKNKLEDQVNLSGCFCTGNCLNGVSVTIDDQVFSVDPKSTEAFFEKEVLGRLSC